MPSKYIREASDEDSKCFFSYTFPIFVNIDALLLSKFICNQKEELSNKSSLKYSGLFTFLLQRLCSNPSRSLVWVKDFRS